MSKFDKILTIVKQISNKNDLNIYAELSLLCETVLSSCAVVGFHYGHEIEIIGDDE